jgi:hypothetical protein
MRRVAMPFTVVALVLVLAGSALATHLPTTGTPLRLLNQAATPTTFAANTPFFVRHGWICPPEERALCLDPTSGSGSISTAIGCGRRSTWAQPRMRPRRRRRATSASSR